MMKTDPPAIRKNRHTMPFYSFALSDSFRQGSVDMTWVVTVSSTGRTIYWQWKRTGTVYDYSLTHSNKHSLKDDYSFQLDIGHYDQINAPYK